MISQFLLIEYICSEKRNPCKNGGRCVKRGKGEDDYTCFCKRGFYGPNCAETGSEE